MQAGKKTILTIIFSTIFIIAAHAQTIRLTGKVLNEKNEPLAGVSVKIVGGGGTTTDIEGRFSISLIPGKKYDIEISAVGYAAKTINETEVMAGQVNDLSITLEVKAQTGDNVVVSAKTSTARKETVSAIIAFQKK